MIMKVSKDRSKVVLANLILMPDIYPKVVVAQKRDENHDNFLYMECMVMDDNMIIRFYGRIYVPLDEEVKKALLEKAH